MRNFNSKIRFLAEKKQTAENDIPAVAYYSCYHLIPVSDSGEKVIYAVKNGISLSLNNVPEILHQHYIKNANNAHHVVFLEIP